MQSDQVRRKHLITICLWCIVLQSIVCTMAMKWYPHPELLHCIKGCEVRVFSVTCLVIYCIWQIIELTISAQLYSGNADSLLLIAFILSLVRVHNHFCPVSRLFVLNLLLFSFFLKILKYDSAKYVTRLMMCKTVLQGCGFIYIKYFREDTLKRMLFLSFCLSLGSYIFILFFYFVMNVLLLTLLKVSCHKWYHSIRSGQPYHLMVKWSDRLIQPNERSYWSHFSADSLWCLWFELWVWPCKTSKCHNEKEIWWIWFIRTTCSACKFLLLWLQPICFMLGSSRRVNLPHMPSPIYSHSWETTTVIRSTTEPSVTTMEETAANPLSRPRRYVAPLCLTIAGALPNTCFHWSRSIFVPHIWSHKEFMIKSHPAHMWMFFSFPPQLESCTFYLRKVLSNTRIYCFISLFGTSLNRFFHFSAWHPTLCHW